MMAIVFITSQFSFGFIAQYMTGKREGVPRNKRN